MIPEWAIQNHEVAAILPQDGWIRQYVEYAQRLTDAPVIWHWGAALTILGSAISPYADMAVQSEFDLARSPICFWTVFIGRSGDRKSTAMRIAKVIHDRATMGTVLDLPHDGSSESWCDLLAGNNNGIFFREEISSLFTSDRKSYSEFSKSMLLQMHAGDPYMRTRVLDRKNRGTEEGDEPKKAAETIVVTRPRVSILGAIQPDIFTKSTSSHDWHSGFLPRCVFLPAIKEKSFADRIEDSKTEGMLAAWLYEITRDFKDTSRDGPTIILIPKEQSRKIFDYCNARFDSNRNRLPPHLFSHFLRYQNLAKQIAAMYAVSRWHDCNRKKTSKTPTVDNADSELAINALEIISEAAYCFFSGMAQDPELSAENAVLAAFRDAKEWTTAPCVADTLGYMSRKRVYGIVKTLLEFGLLEDRVAPRSAKQRGRAAVQYRFID